jgi:phosphoenolpyruvate-protein phosphotransferase (PTS system enzyme I)
MAERVLRGIGVSPGVAWAPAAVVRMDLPDVPDRAIDPSQVEGEIGRLHDAAADVVLQLQALGERVLQRAGPEESRIFDAQMMMVQDPDFIASVEHLIRTNRLSAETAYEFKALELRAIWQSSASAHLRERLADLHAIHMRMLYRLTGRGDEELWTIPSEEHLIIVAHELSPGLTVQLDREQIVGLVSEEGTRTAHAAILAHSLGIPAVMGAAGALDRIPNGAMVLLDGGTGTIIVNPSELELEEARVRMSRRQKLELQLEGMAEQPSVTPDGRRLVLMGNVDLPDEIKPAVEFGAEGVGLLRTEFLLTGRASIPTEDEQTAYFRRVAAAFPRHTVVVRSFDLGGDKFPASFRAPPEANPFLGWRSIRVCLDHPEVFRDQLRAVLRAAADRDVQLMLPLVTRVAEVREACAMLEEEADSLARAGVRAARTVPVGVMIETPAAVLMADRLADVCAFFSVGTNDLTQYTLAVDRGNARLADRFAPHHPAVVRQLHQLAETGRRLGIPVSVCGEMASEPLHALMLSGLGYDRLSVAPPALPLVKLVLRTVPDAVARRAAEDALAATEPEDVEAAIHEAVRHHFDLRLLDPNYSLPGRKSGASLPTDISPFA